MTQPASPPDSPSSKTRPLPDNRLGTLLREPLSVFFLIGCGLFAINALVAPEEQSLVISDSEIEARLLLAELDKDAPLSAAEIEEVTDEFITQQVLVAEARARGLDQDSRIDILLAEKMLHVLSAEVRQPTATELQAFYTSNLASYEQPARYSAEEIVLERTDSRALATVLETESSRIRPLPTLRAGELGSIFSPAFAREAIALGPKWSGPFESNRGQHWLRIIETTPSYTPQFDEIKELVRAGWLQQAEAQQELELTEELVKSYRIIRAPAPQAAGETAAQ
jgi:hypothetical protein